MLTSSLYGQLPLTVIMTAGDAAHPVLPTLGQGACMAIEDAFELANALGALLVGVPACSHFTAQRSAQAGVS